MVGRVTSLPACKGDQEGHKSDTTIEEEDEGHQSFTSLIRLKKANIFMEQHIFHVLLWEGILCLFISSC